MGTYIPFTEQQREQARLTDLAAFLRQCGEEVKRSGSENMWLDHGQKVTIRGNLWFHQYEQVGGDAVDFVRRFYNLDYREAVLTLTSMGVGHAPGACRTFPTEAVADSCQVREYAAGIWIPVTAPWHRQGGARCLRLPGAGL